MTKPTMTSLPLAISGLDKDHVADIQISLLDSEKSEYFKFNYSKMLGYVLDYNTNEISSTAQVKFEHPAYETLIVELDRLWKNKRVYLGKKGSKYVRRGQLDMPFLPQPNKIGAVINKAADLDELKRLLKEKNLKADVPDGLNTTVVISTIDNKDLDVELLTWLAKQEIINAFGPLMNSQTEKFSFLTNHMDILFAATASPQEIDQIYKQFNLKQNLEYKFAQKLYSVSGPKVAGLEILTMANELRKLPVVKEVDIQIYENIGKRKSKRKNNRGIGNR